MRFTCEKFDRSELAIALSNSYTSAVEITRKNHFEYFLEYLGQDGLKAKTIIIERDYINLDYLTDYTEYYAQCFQKYPKTCKRVHFFSKEFDATFFKQVITEDPKSDANKAFWKHYLGYIVVRPIPQRIIGTSLLRTYPEFEEDGDVHRLFFGGRDYTIHLFGNEITIPSLAFQEQDRILSACATAAIWSMLHKASSHHYAVLKTPSEITKDANINGVHGERLFPNDGLTTLQITTAIQKAGMVTEVRSNKQKGFNNSYIKRLVNAYAAIGVPLLMGLEVPVDEFRTPMEFPMGKKMALGSAANTGKEAATTAGEAVEKLPLGFHATTVCGYRWKKFESGKPSEDITWRSDAIEKLLVHDDQWGPFARMLFDDESENAALITDWSLITEEPTPITDVIIPLYHKIRIKFEEVEVLINALDYIFWNIFDKGDYFKEDISWDVYLDYSETFKGKVKKHLSGLKLHTILQKSLPKYIWVANCFVGSNKAMTIVFDATDLSVNMYALFAIFHNEKFRTRLYYGLSQYREFSEAIRHPARKKFVDFLINQAI